MRIEEGADMMEKKPRKLIPHDVIKDELLEHNGTDEKENAVNQK